MFDISDFFDLLFLIGFSCFIALIFFLGSLSSKTRKGFEGLSKQFKNVQEEIAILRGLLEKNDAKNEGAGILSHESYKPKEVHDEAPIVTSPYAPAELEVAASMLAQEPIESESEHSESEHSESEALALIYTAEERDEISHNPLLSKKPESIKKEKKEKNDFEKYIGENLLSKIGIATLVLGIAYFVKHAIDQDWINEIGRVAIGILTGAGIIAVAHKLRDNYRTFSSILVGGGIAILYVTITLAFREYEIFSQTVAFILLIAITAFSVLLSVYYDRKELALFSLLGGFASPLMISTGAGNYIVLFSYILILNTGMLVLAYIKNWRAVSFVSYVFTQAFYWVWLLNSFHDQTLGAIIFGLLFFVQFYLLAFAEHFNNKQKLSAFQAFVILGNSLSLFASSLYIYADYAVNVKGVITIGIALLNALPMWVLFRRQELDKNMLYLLIALVLGFVSLAVPIQLDGYAISMFWAVEAIILLWLWQKSAIKVFQVGFVIVEVLVLLSLFMDWTKVYLNYHALEVSPLSVVLNRIFITGLIVTASIYCNIYLLNKEKKGTSFFISDVKGIKFGLQIIGLILLFLVPFLELTYQVDRFYDTLTFRQSIYGLYIFTFIAIMAIYRWKKAAFRSLLYWILAITAFFYSSFYMAIINNLGEEVIYGIMSSWSYFAMHYLSLPSFILFLIYLLKNKDAAFKSPTPQNWVYWFVCLLAVLVLSVEMDNLLLLLFGNENNIFVVLYNSHTIGYPILWAVCSFVLMLLGMRQEIKTLRIISLSLFGLIIGKLYLIDVWSMSQTGRIVAFIFLGMVLLFVSFLYQKLKRLLANKTALDDKNNDNAETKENEEIEK